MIEKTIFPDDYGIAFLSVDLFMEENKKEKYEHNTCYGNIYAQRIIFFLNFFFLYF